MRSTMMDVPLSLNHLLDRAGQLFPDNEIVSRMPDKTLRRHTYGEYHRRTRKLAAALQALGLKKGDRVATLSWNHHAHLECYFGIPAAGGVMHTLNLRLAPDEIGWIAHDAEDRFLIVDDILLPLYRQFADKHAFEKVIVFPFSAAPVDTSAGHLDYEALLEHADGDAFVYAAHDEDDPVAMCYTSGTTGRSKGVVYSHRSTVLHTFVGCLADHWGLRSTDCLLPVTPMFHANSWGLAYAAVMTGASLAMPDRWLQAEPLCRFMGVARPTISGAVPTVWNDVLSYLDQHEDLELSSHLRLVLCGGSAVPIALQQALGERHGIHMVQAWGMTETSPVASVARPPRGVEGEDTWRYRGGQGRLLPGIEGRIVGDAGDPLPRDGQAVGELEVRGVWVTGAYYKDDDPEKFRDGWLRTGDVGTLDELGYIALTDRAKDVIKSGGEWISSVELENALMSHPDVQEAAVVGIPDEKWAERPMASVVLREGAEVTPAELREFLSSKVAKWQLPDAWTFIDAVPRTSVGKFDKKVIRRWYADGELEVSSARE